MKKFALLTILTFIFSSCMTLHKGYLSPLSQNIDESEFTYVETVYGESAAYYLFGLGGGSKKGLIGQAKQDLRKKNKLKENQALINFTVDNQFQTIFGIISINRMIISADLVERKK